MHIRKISLKHIKLFEAFEWALEEDDPGAGWHVLLGDNGSGKSTVLRACAVALMGPREAPALRQNWAEWLSRDAQEGAIHLDLSRDKDWDPRQRRGAVTMDSLLSVAGLSDPTRVLSVGVTLDPQGIADATGNSADYRGPWRSEDGWFSASFGPFRRFSGGNQEYDRLFSSRPALARHLTIFGEGVALTKTLDWLQELRFQQLERRASREEPIEEPDLLQEVMEFINQDGFLPNGTCLREVNSREVVFRDGNGVDIGIEALSDGYRSILSLALELLRQLTKVYDPRALFQPGDGTIQVAGVVLIDEIDVHLHPSWQRRVGPWLTKHFPNIQFIVTTHSPLICQGANPGSITRLAQPGDDDIGGRVTGAALNRLLYGNILEAYGSGVFGTQVERSDAGQDKLQRLAALNRKARRTGLREDEEREQRQLQAIFATDTEVTQADSSER